MRKSGLWLGGGLIGMIVGYSMGYLRIPLIGSDKAFWVGTAMGIAIVLLVLSLRMFRKPAETKATRAGSRIVLLLLSGGILISLLLQSQLSRRSTQLQEERLLVLKQEALQEAERQQKIGKMIADKLQSISGRSEAGIEISQEDIEDLKRLSEQCIPYFSVTEDSISPKKFSPERGLLLTGLLSLDLSDTTLLRVLQTVSFASADLSGLPLNSLNLKGIDLQEANLEQADLRNSSLTGADLRGAILIRTMLAGADLTKVDARRADISWARLDGARISEGNFDGITGRQLSLNNATAIKARFQYADMSGSFIEESDLRMIDGELTNFSGTSFRKTTLQGSNLCRSLLEEASFDQTIVDSCSIETESWLNDLSDWKVIGGEAIQERHIIVPDTQQRYARSRLILVHKDHTD